MLILVKRRGDQSNIFNTTGKIFVLNNNVVLERLVFLEQIKNLTEENMGLKEEVDKIHYRYEILDL